jgi:hypothetical protein
MNQFIQAECLAGVKRKPRSALELTGALTLSNKRKLPSLLMLYSGVTFGDSLGTHCIRSMRFRVADASACPPQ